MIGVVACSKSKLAAPARAEDLYTGRTFRGAVRLLRAWGCTRIVVLSALHGAVADDRVLAPYEHALADQGADARRRWVLVARAELSRLVCELARTSDLAGVDVHAIVPAAYAAALDLLPTVTRHFAGLTQGHLFSAVKRALAEVA